jgi:hypothetical protein
MISIAHDGQELGQFSEEDTAAMLESGQIDRTAHYWMKGMTEWRPITEIIQVKVWDSGVAEAAEEPPKSGKSKRDPNTPNKAHLNFLSRRNVPTDGLTKESAAALVEQVKREEERERKAMTPSQKAFLDYHKLAYSNDTTVEQASDLISSANVADSNWRKERHILHPNLFTAPVVLLMTDKQRAYLDYHGVAYAAETTREEATDLINDVIENPQFADSKWNTYKHLIRPDLYAKPAPSLSAKEELKDAKERLTAAQEELKKLRSSSDADADDIESAKQEVEEIREEVEDLKIQIEDDKLAVQEGSDDVSSFVDAWGEGYYEPTGEDVEQFKKVVKKPTKTQYKALREKLDADLGLALSILTVDQFLCLYIQQYPEVLKEPYKSSGFPALSLQIPKTYQQQLQLEQASSQGTSASTASAKKGCLGLVLLIAAPIGALFAMAVLLL